MPERRTLNGPEAEELLRRATEAREHAVAPYSRFRVGAALLAADGVVYKGCNVESATYGLTCCAERTAVFKALSEGARSFVAVAVVTGEEAPTPPCGACRQVLWDQCREIEVICATTAGVVERRMLSTLYPRPFEFGGPK